jgi:hypothetical protein
LCIQGSGNTFGGQKHTAGSAETLNSLDWASKTVRGSSNWCHLKGAASGILAGCAFASFLLQ